MTFNFKRASLKRYRTFRYANVIVGSSLVGVRRTVQYVLSLRATRYAYSYSFGALATHFRVSHELENWFCSSQTKMEKNHSPFLAKTFCTYFLHLFHNKRNKTMPYSYHRTKYSLLLVSLLAHFSKSTPVPNGESAKVSATQMADQSEDAALDGTRIILR